MMRGVSEVGSRLRARRERCGGDADPARAFLDWLRADNFVMLGLLRYQFGAGRSAARRSDQRARRLQGPGPAAGRLPRPDGGRGRTAAPRRRRRSHHRHRLLPAAPKPSITSSRSTTSSSASGGRTVRLAAATLLIGRLAKGALTAKPQDVPLVQREAGVGAGTVRRGEQLARLSRNARAVQSLPAPRAALRRRGLAQDHDRSHDLHVERQRDRRHPRARAPATWRSSIAFSDLHYSHKAEEDLRARARRGVRTDLVQHVGRSGRHRPARCSTSTKRRSSTRSTSRRCAQITSSASSPHGRTASAATLEQAFGALEGRRLFKRYVRTRDAQRPVPRVHQARRGARGSASASRCSKPSSKPASARILRRTPR